MRHIRWVAPKDSLGLTEPVVVFGFSGWNDAGQAATTALDGIIGSNDAALVAEIDPESYTDFATIRPEIKLDASGNRVVDWPTVRVFAAKLPGTDVLLVVGPEPSLRWRRFSEELVELFEYVGAELVIALGSLIAEVPHTRPTPVYGLTSDPTAIDRFDLQPSSYEGPTGIVGVITAMARAAGIPTASLWAAVPSYVAQIMSPAAAEALTTRACDMIGTPAPTLDLADKVAMFNEHLDNILAEDDELERYVAQLESISDAELARGTDGSGANTQLDADEIDSAVIAAEIEEFLRGTDND